MNIKKSLFESITDSYTSDPSVIFDEAASFTYGPENTGSSVKDPEDVGKHDYIRQIHSTTPEEFEAQKAAANTEIIPDYRELSDNISDALDFADTLGDSDIAELGDDEYELVAPINASTYEEDGDFIHNISMEDPDWLLKQTKETQEAETAKPVGDIQSNSKLVSQALNTIVLKPKDIVKFTPLLFNKGSVTSENSSALGLWNAVKGLSTSIADAEQNGYLELVSKLKDNQLQLQKELARTLFFKDRLK